MVFLWKLPMWIPLPIIFKLSWEQCCSLYLTSSATIVASEWLSEIHCSLSSQQPSKVRIYHPYFQSAKLTSWVIWIFGRTRIKDNCSDIVLLKQQRQTFPSLGCLPPSALLQGAPYAFQLRSHGADHVLILPSVPRPVTLLHPSSHP